MLPWLFSSRLLVLDLGATGVSLGLFRCSRRGRLELEEVVVEPLRTTPSETGPQLSDYISALDEVRQKLTPGDRRGRCVVLLPRHLALTRVIRCPTIAGAQRHKLLSFEAQQAIAAPLDEMIWDHAVLRESEQELDVLLAAWSRSLAAELDGHLASRRLRPIAVVPRLVALLHAAEAAAGTARNWLLVDVGAQASDLWLAGGGLLVLRTVSAGPEPDSESGEDRGWVEQLEAEIRRTSLSHRRQGGQEIELILLTGEALEASGLTSCPALAGVPHVRRLEDCASWTRSRSNATAAGLREEALLGSMTVAIMAAERQGSLRGNLVGTEARQRSKQRRREAGMVVALVGLTLLTTAFGEWYARLAQRASARADELQARRVMAGTTVAQLQQERQRQAEIQQSGAELEALALSRTAWVRLLAHVHDCLLPEPAMWIEQLKVRTPPRPALSGSGRVGLFGQPVSSAAPTLPLRVELSLTGVMLDQVQLPAHGDMSAQARVKRVLKRLGHASFITSVSSERFDSPQPGMLRFNLVVVLAPPRAGDSS